MSFEVQLTADAVRDLEDIYRLHRPAPVASRADHVLERIERAFSGLSEHPNRGRYPRELLDLGIREYREIYFKPYRIIYRAIENTVYVFLIADGRRDMQTLLQRRLLQA